MELLVLAVVVVADETAGTVVDTAGTATLGCFGILSLDGGLGVVASEPNGGDEGALRVTVGEEVPAGVSEAVSDSASSSHEKSSSAPCCDAEKLSAEPYLMMD